MKTIDQGHLAGKWQREDLSSLFPWALLLARVGCGVPRGSSLHWRVRRHRSRAGMDEVQNPEGREDLGQVTSSSKPQTGQWLGAQGLYDSGIV